MTARRQPGSHNQTILRTRLKRGARAVAVGLVACIAITLSVLHAPTSARAVGRELTVAPATELGNQVVFVHWSGFTSGAYVMVQQCKAHPVSLADCDTAEPYPNSENGNEVKDAQSQADGTGDAFLEARPVEQSPALGCSAESPCSIIAWEDDGSIIPPHGLPHTAVTAPITFAKTAADCPAVTNFDLRAEGEASSSQAFYRWIAGLCTADPNLVVDYTETSSVAGREDFLANEVDVGVTSTAATESELAASHAKFTYAPVDLTAVTVAYNMSDLVTGQRITDLTLSPRLLTRLITDTQLLDFFNDPEFRALNPGHTWPDLGLSVPLIRAERNADTYIATSWMASDAGSKQFLADTDRYGVSIQPAYKDYAYPTDVFEDVDGNTAYVPRQGESEVARRVFYGVTPTGGEALSTLNYGFMGLVDLPTAERFDLPVAKLVNASGHAVAPNEASILAGYAAMKTQPDGITKFPDFSTTDADAYPLVKVDYAMMPTEPSAKLGAALKRFLTFASTDGQESVPAGFVTMPDDLVAQTAAAVDAIGTPTTPPTTTPTTTPVTTPTTFPPIEDLGPIGGGDFGTAPEETAPPETVAPPVTSPTKRAAAAKPQTLGRSKPVVNVADTAERWGLPIVVGLALLAGLYPLTRTSAPLVGRGLRSFRKRWSRSPPPTVDPTP